MKLSIAISALLITGFVAPAQKRPVPWCTANTFHILPVAS